MVDGILIIDKDEGMTSRKVDNEVSHLFQTKKVGHLGTLDPFATGLLVVTLGKASKFLQFIVESPKTYKATLKLGYKSSTGDKDGEISFVSKPLGIDEEKIKETLATFLGKSKQIPPMTSAIKINGEALYKLAHKGIEIERKERDIEIFSIKLLSFKDDVIEFEASVSSGTYIRTLGEDIASRLGSCGYLTALRRLKVGSIDLTKAVKVKEATLDSIINPVSLITDIEHFEVGEITANDIRNGKTIKLDSSKDRLLLLNKGAALAVYERKENGFYSCLRGLF